jgi:endonuclease/exonuclease/phosphatase family metal-dependent hydrolase
MYSAGCGIISRYPMTDVENVKFELSFPTPRKGFLSATLSIAPEIELTVASVHMVLFDILKSDSHENQIDRMADALAHKKAVVIGGDLNIGLRSRHMKTLLSKLNVTHHHSSHDHKHMRTFPAIRPQRRLDWILTSPHLGVSDYRTFPHRVSDHLAVGTTISL